ncbi:MAG TPA: hypothetical protein VGK00_03110 [Anaerolineales bacterium]|jgi:hypothetical protein
MDNPALNSEPPQWVPPRKYFHAGLSPLDWNPADPTAPATLNGNRRESARANRALCDYCALGGARSFTSLLEAYASNSAAPTHSLDTLKKWSVTWNWRDRLLTYDTINYQRKKRLYNQRLRSIIETGLSLRHERIEKLKTAYVTLETFLDDPDFIFPRLVKKIPAPDGGFELVESRRFNAEIFIQLRGILADLARETNAFPPHPLENSEDDELLDPTLLTRRERDAMFSLFNKASGKLLDAYDTLVLGPSDPETE